MSRLEFYTGIAPEIAMHYAIKTILKKYLIENKVIDNNTLIKSETSYPNRNAYYFKKDGYKYIVIVHYNNKLSVNDELVGEIPKYNPDTKLYEQVNDNHNILLDDEVHTNKLIESNDNLTKLNDDLIKKNMELTIEIANLKKQL